MQMLLSILEKYRLLGTNNCNTHSLRLKIVNMSNCNNDTHLYRENKNFALKQHETKPWKCNIIYANDPFNLAFRTHLLGPNCSSRKKVIQESPTKHIRIRTTKYVHVEK